jgi:hypothetical protein
MDSDMPVVGALFTFLTIIVGQFFMLNLILAVIIDAFMKKHEEVRIEEEQDKNLAVISEDTHKEESSQSSSQTSK